MLVIALAVVVILNLLAQDEHIHRLSMQAPVGNHASS